MSSFGSQSSDNQLFKQMSEPFQGSKSQSKLSEFADELEKPMVSQDSIDALRLSQKIEPPTLPESPSVPEPPSTSESDKAHERKESSESQGAKGQTEENTAVSPESQQLEQAIANHRFRKMRGWLSILMVASVIATIVNVLYAFMWNIVAIVFLTEADSIGMIDVILLLVGIAAILSTIIAIVFIARVFLRKPKFLRVLQVAQLLNLLPIVLLTIYVYYMLLIVFGNTIDEIVIIMQGLTIISIVHICNFFILTLYFCKSKRVRVYMGSDEHISKALVKFKHKKPLDVEWLDSV